MRALIYVASMRTMHLLLAATMLLPGCGQQGSRSPATSGDEPVTPAALAYVATEYVGEPDSAGEGSNIAEAFRQEPVQAELRFGSTGEYDGDAIQLVVGRRLREPVTNCAQMPADVSGCEDLESGFWYWGEEEPEEDPGAVFVVQRKRSATVILAYYGPSIKRDPRRQNLPIKVETLIDLAADPRVNLTTTKDAVEEGAKAPYWRA